MNTLATARIQILIIDDDLRQIDIRYLISEIMRKRSKLKIVTRAQNLKEIGSTYDHSLLNEISGDITPDLSYALFHNNLSRPGGKKFDLRLIQTILVSIPETIKKNAELEITPEKVKKEGICKVQGDFSSIIALHGAGLLGVLGIVAPKNFIKAYAARMIGIPEDELNNDLMQDVTAELINQIFGVIKAQLSKFGYALHHTIHISSSALDQSYTCRNTGYYYTFPFDFNGEKLNIIFWTDAYKIPILSQPKTKSANTQMDVRLFNNLIENVVNVIKINLGSEPKRVSYEPQKNQYFETELLSMMHGFGPFGWYFFAIETPNKTAELIVKKIFGDEEIEGGVDLRTDLISELLNQVRGLFKPLSEKFAYKFLNLFYGDFASIHGVRYQMKSTAKLARIHFELEGTEFTMCFGMKTEVADQIYDIWPHINNKAS